MGRQLHQLPNRTNVRPILSGCIGPARQSHLELAWHAPQNVLIWHTVSLIHVDAPLSLGSKPEPTQHLTTAVPFLDVHFELPGVMPAFGIAVCHRRHPAGPSCWSLLFNYSITKAFQMPIPLTCPYCQQRIDISKQNVEQNVQCCFCNRVFYVSVQVCAIGSSEADPATASQPPSPPFIGPESLPFPAVRKKVRQPAIGLMITGAATTLLGLMFIPALLFPETIGQQGPIDTTDLVLSLILMVVTLSLGIVTLHGSIKMFNFESYQLSVAAAIAAIVPCYCCLLGLPVGIWALVVLRDANVKRVFLLHASDQAQT